MINSSLADSASAAASASSGCAEEEEEWCPPCPLLCLSFAFFPFPFPFPFPRTFECFVLRPRLPDARALLPRFMLKQDLMRISGTVFRCEKGSTKD